jgi:hypothetical protein
MNIKKASFDEIVSRGVEEFPQLWYAVNHDLVALATEDLTRDPMRRMVALAVYRSLDAARDHWAATIPATRAGNQRPQTPNDPESSDAVARLEVAESSLTDCGLCGSGSAINGICSECREASEPAMLRWQNHEDGQTIARLNSEIASLKAERDELVKMLEIAIEVSSDNWSILRQNSGQRKWYYLTNNVGTDGGFDSALEAYRALTENKEEI